MLLKEYNLEGKVAIVTGAGRGIGKGIALTLAEAGADIVAAARTPEQVEETAQEIRHLGRKCLAVPTDVTRSDQVEQMVERTISEFGQIDVLVNNAGVFVMKPLVPMLDSKSRLPQILPHFDQISTSVRHCVKSKQVYHLTPDNKTQTIVTKPCSRLFSCFFP